MKNKKIKEDENTKKKKVKTYVDLLKKAARKSKYYRDYYRDYYLIQI